MRTTLFLSLAALLVAGCSFLMGGASSEEAEMARLRRQIDAVIGTPTASDAALCRTVGLGTKPCGGPWTYLVYSAEQTDTTRLMSLVARYNAVERRLNERTGRASDCMMVMPPQLSLRGGACTPVTP